MNTRLDEARSRYDLLAYIESVLGSRGNGRNPTFFQCPFHNDGSASLAVYRDGHFHCFGAGCGAHGDLINFVALLNNCTISEAIDDILGDVKPIVTPRPATPVKDAPALTMHDVLRGYDNFEIALPFLRSRAITEGVARNHYLGATLNFPATYHFTDGRELGLSCVRYTIPNLWGEQVRGINLRRDDNSALRAVQGVETRLRTNLRADIAQRKRTTPERVSDEDIARYIFPKYQKRRSSRNVIFNLSRLVMLSDGALCYHPLSYVFVTEGEYDALALESAGYPAVSLKLNRTLDPSQAFKGVNLIYIIADNDPPAQKPGGIEVNEALEMARALQKQIGRGRVITPPRDYKDANEVVIDGAEQKWLNQFGIEPIFERSR